MRMHSLIVARPIFFQIWVCVCVIECVYICVCTLIASDDKLYWQPSKRPTGPFSCTTLNPTPSSMSILHLFILRGYTLRKDTFHQRAETERYVVRAYTLTNVVLGWIETALSLIVLLREGKKYHCINGNSNSNSYSDGMITEQLDDVPHTFTQQHQTEKKQQPKYFYDIATNIYTYRH